MTWISGRKRHQLNFKVYYVTLRETSETTLAYSSLSERETENPGFSRLNRRVRFWKTMSDVSRKTQRFCSGTCSKQVKISRKRAGVAVFCLVCRAGGKTTMLSRFDQIWRHIRDFELQPLTDRNHFLAWRIGYSIRIESVALRTVWEWRSVDVLEMEVLW